MSFITRSRATGTAASFALITGASILLAACGSSSDRPADSTVAMSAADTVPSTEGMIDVPGGRVWYRKLGNGPGTPLLALHGGPGGTACRFEVLAPLARERPVIFYDQLGSGRSDHPTDTSLWRVDRFVAELSAVRQALGLTRVHLLGHSWGGALAAEYMAAAKPDGVVSVIFSSPLIDTPRWIADADSLRAQLPAEIRRVLDEEERKGTLDSPAYMAATDSFYARHVRRLPVADEPRCAGVASNDTIYRQMWGPTEFLSTGSLRTWTRAAELKQITQPTLFVAGEFDEARPSTLEEFRATMRDAQMVVIPGAAHAAMREKPAEYVDAVRAFLARVEQPAGK
ncbi:proline iminopeptidase-family hydrolase [Gemmatimonas sp.]|jgi:proline iminopeptidase|uniref:proline iminopeptidase-family hydrolase n=1 Tax=Gemmatimonas sp. TaxID=1962908 RepID=UPI0037BF4B02